MLLGYSLHRFQGTAPARVVSGLWGQWYRHFIALFLLLCLAVLFALSRGGELSIGVLGLGFADASVILLCVTLSIGPAVRLRPGLYPIMTWRRHLGIAVVAGALMHILAFEALDLLALPKLFLDQVDGRIVLQKDEVAAASWIGLTALVYVTVLGITSNDFSQRLLGRAWKQVHGQSHTLFVLAVIHSALAVYVLEESKGVLFPYALWMGIATTLGLQLADFVATVRQSRKRKANA
jgi:DMSO/TMAO reductase YedYZ heme-binding membrane subunit